MQMLQTLRANPRVAWIGTCITGMISGVVSGYTLFDSVDLFSHKHLFWLEEMGRANFLQVLMPGLSLGIGLALYFLLLGRASTLRAVLYAAAITFGYYIAAGTGYWWGWNMPYKWHWLPYLVGFSIFALAVAVASAALFQECRSARLFIGMVGTSVLSVTLIAELMSFVDNLVGLVERIGLNGVHILLFVFFSGPIAAVIGYGVFLVEPKGSKHKRA